MDVRYNPDSIRFQRMTTKEIRDAFLVNSLFSEGEIILIYSDTDRAIIGSAVPKNKPLTLASAKELASDYFAQRREIGIINIGGSGEIRVDGKTYAMSNRDGLYIGRGSQSITFSSKNPSEPARYYLLSYPAHAQYPTAHIQLKDAAPVELGSDAECNKRVIYKYIHPEGSKSCQLVMGFTELAEGNVWNTMPPHTHERRTEIYMYFDVEKTARVFHLMGTPGETRHIVVKNGEAVISPSWSIHSGVGTRNYCFVWGMGGENQAFDDMDFIDIDQIK